MSDDDKNDGMPLIKPARTSLFARLRGSFLAGVVVAAPIAITVIIIYWFITTPMAWIDARVRQSIPERFIPDNLDVIFVPGMGVVIAVIVLTLLGALARNLFGRALIGLGERFVDRMPIVRNLYKALKQIFETVLSQTETSFKEVGLIEYPRKGIWAVGFVAATAKGEIQYKTDGEVVSVFVPTTPNPTSGFLLFVPRSEIIPLDMSVEEAAKVVISAGLVTPAFAPPAEDVTEAREALRMETDALVKAASGPEEAKTPVESAPKNRLRVGVPKFLRK